MNGFLQVKVSSHLETELVQKVSARRQLLCKKNCTHVQEGFPGGKESICLPMQEIWVPSLGQEDPLRRKQQPTLVFMPGNSHGPRSLAGYSPWGCKESDLTQRLNSNNMVGRVLSLANLRARCSSPGFNEVNTFLSGLSGRSLKTSF